MYIVAIGWGYVVLMMSIAEESVVAGIMTFLLYGVLPLTIIFYIAGSGKRRRRQAEEDQRRREVSGQSDPAADPADQPGNGNPPV